MKKDEILTLTEHLTNNITSRYFSNVYSKVLSTVTYNRYKGSF